MVEKRPIDKLKIQGFKSLQDVELELRQVECTDRPKWRGEEQSSFLL